MAVTTMREFVDALEAITITGVTQQWTQGPPTQVNDPDVPCTYVKLPNSVEGPLVFQNQGGWPTLRATHVILVEAVAQNLQPVNFDAAVDMMDALSSALRGGEADCGTLAKSHITWSQRQGIETVSGVEYWAIFTDVEAQG
jgi:hypothetical protein